MNWKIFDKIIVYIDNNYQNLNLVKYHLKNNFNLCNLDNVIFYFKPQNKIISKLYQILIKNKIIVDWYNSQIEGDFLYCDDFCYTYHLLDLIKSFIYLKYNKIFIFGLGCFNNGLHNLKNYKNALNEFPETYDGIVNLRYDGECEDDFKFINNYYSMYNITNISKINLFALSYNAMCNIINNETMIPKKIDYYLCNRNMPGDKDINYIFLNKKNANM